MSGMSYANSCSRGRSFRHRRFRIRAVARPGVRSAAVSGEGRQCAALTSGPTLGGREATSVAGRSVGRVGGRGLAGSRPRVMCPLREVTFGNPLPFFGPSLARCDRSLDRVAGEPVNRLVDHHPLSCGV